MAIAASGAVAMSDLRTEYNDSGSIALSDLYLGGASNLVRANAGNNSSTNLSAGVPASGVIKITDFYSKARGFRKTYSAGAENQDLSTVFGTDWGVDYPKDVVINAGVTIGATATSNEALEVNSGGLGTIVITNNGTIIGAGGAAGSAGGDAFEASVACTLVNNGTISAGGGGGGNGGTGGNGTVSTSSVSYVYSTSNRWVWDGEANNGYIKRNGTQYWWYSYYSMTYTSNGGGLYRGSLQGSANGGHTAFFSLGTLTSSTSSTTGGSGGSGGVGQGYNQTNTSGSAGAAGGTNAGTGGTGSDGATYGLTASNGSTGANGNSTNGSAGSTGGAAGAAVSGTTITLNNTGTVHGAVS